MTAKGFYTYSVIMLLLALVLVYLLNAPLLPIARETKEVLGYPEESLLNFTELVGRYGLETQEHIVPTEDGYLLRVYRVRKRDCGERGAPVILQHGLLQGASCWGTAGSRSPLLLAANACFDLWLPNTRGTRDSRAHISLSPSERTFWHFSVDEIGRYDLPAVIDHVLNRTGHTHLNYIGFSQGAGSFFIMCSELPHYCEKVGIMIALAPASRQTNTKSVLYRGFAQTIMRLEGMLSGVGVHELFGKSSIAKELLAFFCQVSSFTESVCEAGRSLFDAPHPGSVSPDTVRRLYGHFPTGTSVHNMARYGQSMLTEHFQKYDYGKEKNLGVYGSVDPPKYNLSAVSVPVVAIYGRNDYLVDMKDVRWLLAQLPHVAERVLVRDPLWNHLDSTYSQHFGEMVFPKIYEYLMRYR